MDNETLTNKEQNMPEYNEQMQRLESQKKTIDVILARRGNGYWFCRLIEYGKNAREIYAEGETLIDALKGALDFLEGKLHETRL